MILHIYAEPRGMIIFENAELLSPPVQGRDMCVLEGEHWIGNRTLPLCLTISKMEERMDFLDLQRISVFNVAPSYEIFKGNYTMHDCGL